MNQIELGVIGGGNMAEAIISAAVKSGFLAPDQILVADPSPERRNVISQLGVGVTKSNLSASQAKRILLAVKPQVMPAILDELAGKLADGTLVISIAAGLNTSIFAKALGEAIHIVRVMPNTPLLVGKGVSGLCAGPGATHEDLRWTTRLLAGDVGMVIRVDEPAMDAVTAVSGSGPAYVFYLAEAMIDAGVAEGLTREQAEALSAQTIIGAGCMLLQHSDTPAEELRRRVTSPGGTTEQAIHTMEAHNVGQAIRLAVRAAAQRSRELGQ